MNQQRNSDQGKQYLEFGEKINENRQLQIQQYARNRVLEPFEGRKSLETVQKTRTSIEKSFSWIKAKFNKTGDWVSETEVASSSKSKITDLVKGIKSASAQSRMSGLFDRLNGPANVVKRFTKSKYYEIEERAKTLAREYLKKGLENIVIESDELWILDRVNNILKNAHFTKLDQIRTLQIDQRNALINSIYPYDSQRFQDFARRFDLTFNLGLGAIVATNIPGTGIAVSLINMAKTLVKLGNRLKIMSAIYGYHITDSQALFKASAAILKSLADWENNKEHLPLDPAVLNELYSDNDSTDSAAFQEMIDAIVKKDAYIAIPGIGSISLGKINLDDIKMDLVVKHLVIDHFAKKDILLEIDKHSFLNMTRDFEAIYLEFKKQRYFSLIRKHKESKHLSVSNKKLKDRLKILVGFDLTLDNALVELDIFSSKIFEKVKNMKPEQKQSSIKKEVGLILSKSVI